MIADVNAARGKVVAADVPSGVDASTGEVAGEAVRAVATAAFHAAKPGLWIAPGKTHAGAVAVIDIGIPSRRARGRRRRAASTPACCATCRAAARTRPSSPRATSSSSAARAG